MVPSTPGATADLLGRVLADSLSQKLGQRFIVVNKAGAAGVIGTAAVARAKPDGYTLLHGAAFSLTVQPLTDRQANYTHKSFEPICQTFKNDQVIVAKPDSPFNSAADLIKATKAKTGGLNYGHPGLATIPHLAMIEFGAAGEGRVQPRPVQGPGRGRADDRMAGRSTSRSVPLPTAATSGLKMPGLFAPARNPAIPDVPTMREQGFDVAPLELRSVRRAGRACPPTSNASSPKAARSPPAATPMSRSPSARSSPTDYYGDAARPRRRTWSRMSRRSVACSAALGLLK